MTKVIDFDNFIFIGNKIADKIYQIPQKDLQWFNKTKSQILENQEKAEKYDEFVNGKIRSAREVYLEAIVERLEKLCENMKTQEGNIAKHLSNYLEKILKEK